MEVDTKEKPTTDKSNFYWTKKTNEAIDEYVDNSDLSPDELSELYTEKLHPTIKKMIKAIIHRYNFYETGENIDDLVTLCHAKVYSTLKKSRQHKDKYYDSSKKSSFFYFTTVIKNYLINLQKANQQHEKRIATNEVDKIGRKKDEYDADHLLYTYLDWLEEHYTKYFTHEVDLQIVEAFLKIVSEESDKIESFRGLSEVIYGELDMDKEMYYSRYYKTKSTLNHIYNKLRRKYIQKGDISVDTKIEHVRKY